MVSLLAVHLLKAGIRAFCSYAVFAIALTLAGCYASKNNAKEDSSITEETTRIIPVGGNNVDGARADVVFVHGLSGDGVETWQLSNLPKNYWPMWISEDNPDIRVWSIDYEAHISAWFGKTLAIQDRSVGLLEELRLQHIGEDRPVVFITHSLGGLIVKQMLRKASENNKWRYILDNTSGVMFLATPHTGSPGATLVNFTEKLIPVATRSTITTEQLRSNDPFLRDLNGWYRENIDHKLLLTSVLSETMPIAGLLIVPENSMDPGITGVVPTPVPEHNHLQMSQPRSRESIIYRSANNFIQTCCPKNARVSLLDFLDRKLPDREKEKNRRVDWIGIVQDISRRQDRDAYILVGKEGEQDAKNRVRAVMQPNKFIDLPIGRKIQVQGILLSTGTLGTVLEHCTLENENVEAGSSK